MKNKIEKLVCEWKRVYFFAPVIAITLLVFVPMISALYAVFPVGTRRQRCIQRFGKKL